MELINFIKDNWVNLGLIIVGLSAVWIYKAQEKEKMRDAASLVVLQIDELQKRVQEIQSYITNQGLNLTAFYESLPLIDVNHWKNYKHLFIRKIDTKSYDSINKFYQYVTSMQEQQELMRNLQKNYFFVKQSALCNVEISFIVETLKEVDSSSVSSKQLQELTQDTSVVSNEKQQPILCRFNILFYPNSIEVMPADSQHPISIIIYRTFLRPKKCFLKIPTDAYSFQIK